LFPAPSFEAEGVVNIATRTADLCPGCIVAISGSNLAGDIESATVLPLPTTLGGSRVLVNDIYVYRPPMNPCQALPAQTPRPFCIELPRSPFQGKDIIYVHGLSTETLKAVVEGETVPNWGFGLPSLTYLAYFSARGDQQWDQHIKRFLDSRNASNRYMIAGWSSAQRIEYAANAMLYQIAEAMINGTRVVAKPADPRGKLGFCANGCVIISHSTGELVTDVAMALADDLNYQQNYGPIGFIAPRMATHVSLGGAFVGSKYATLAVGLGRCAGCEQAGLCGG
jgi:hypothetical protein